MVRDSAGVPYTSTLTPSMPVDEAYPFYANFPAAPSRVTSLTVRLPGGGQPEITDVPLG